MGRGVKKIKMTSGKYYPDRSTSLTKQVTIQPDQFVGFDVIEWLDRTTDKDKEKELTWMRQSNDRKIIIAQIKSSSGYTLKLPKKFCGPYTYYVEASLSGKRDFINSAGVYVNGYCKPIIKATNWRKKPNGGNIKNKKPISYGDIVYIWIDTEGLNGNTITIEVYNQIGYFKADKKIASYNVLVKNGEVLYQIGDTSRWMSKVNNIQKEEQFYIKAKLGRTYLKDHLGDDKHAIYLNVKKELVSNTVKASENITPTKVHKPEVNAERHEPCKFDEVKITIPTSKNGETETKPITVFKHGVTKLVSRKGSVEYINRTIHFDWNDYSITPNAQKILNNILGFLLEHKGTTIRMSGYACVIGEKDYNQKLSQKRSDAVKDFFVSGGLNKDRIISVGRGEYNVQSPDDYNKRNEKEYRDARRVDISFSFTGHAANAIVFETIASSLGTPVTLDITGFNVEDCYRDKNKHKKEITIKSPDSKELTESGAALSFPIKSSLSKFNVAPIQYIWPLFNALNWSDAATVYNVHLHSCRYYTLSKNPTIRIKAYPDIKWEFAFECKIGISNYKAANMPEGVIFSKHQEESRKDGYIRWLMNKQGKVPIKIGLRLDATWDEGRSNRSLTNDHKKKIESFIKVISKSVDILQKAINAAQSVAKTTVIPVSFQIMYPNLVFVGNWFLETNNKNQTAVVGTAGFGFRPLIGAEVVIDLIGAAIASASYATTGNPAVAKLANRFRGGLEKLGAKVIFSATFFGNLNMIVDVIKINENGFNMEGKSTIGGRMGVKIELAIESEIGKHEGEKTKPILDFRAGLQADAYFGGDFVIDSDNKGIFVQPVLKFSGVILVGEIKGEINWWKISYSGGFELSERILPEDTMHLEKKYIT